VVATVLSAQVVVPNGTKITARLEQTLSSATAEVGQPVQLVVTEDIRVNGAVVIAQGAPVLGTVVLAQEKRRMGRTGKLDFSIDKVRATDGEYVPLRYTMLKREGGSKGVSTGIMTAGAAILFWPAAPFVLMRKGKDVDINKGMVFEVFTDQDHNLRPGNLQPLPGAAPAAVAAVPSLQLASQAAPIRAATAVELATITVTSDLPGAEVEVDGSYMGSTPATLKLAPGVHRVAVKHGSNSWARDLNVQPNGNVNVNAILTK
jgi:hypothetical protein